MSLRSRASAVGRWGGLAAVVVIPFLWLASGWYLMSATFENQRMTPACGLYRGMLEMGLRTGPAVGVTPSWGAGIMSARKFDGETPGWWKGQPCRYWTADFSRMPGGGPRYFFLSINLWVLYLAVVAMTAVLWWRHRRARRGCCGKCGYDLAGIGAGVCPECGVGVGVSGPPKIMR
jgi:hypothetical protein